MTFEKICRYCHGQFFSTAPKTTLCSRKCFMLSSFLKSKGCWEWTRSLNVQGYGLVKDGKDKSELAHRASYLLFVGKIPDGLYVLHHCDNRKCINPKHLYCGTHLDNMRDMDSRGRRVIPRPFGESHHLHRLREVDIPIIRKLVSDGASMRSVAKKYDVTYNAIRKVIIRETWDWL